VKHFQLSFGFLQLLQFASLLEDGVGLHEVVLRFLCITCDDQQSANDFLRFGQLGAGLSVKNSFKIFDFSQFLQRLLKMVTSEVDKGDIALDFASTNVFEPIVSFIDRDGFLQVIKSVIDLPTLLLPSTKLGRDAGQEICACELLKLFIDMQSLLLVVNCLFDVSLLRMDLRHL
jgi:hypothetical protein